MSNTKTNQELLEMVKEYFRRIDSGRKDVADLLSDDVDIYFPKFGTANGKAALFELADKLFGTLAKITHNLDTLNCIVQDDTVVVEGTTSGLTKSGVVWTGGETAGGRFCNVFHFRDDKIDRVHIYLDPDYGSEDIDRFLWGN